MQIGEVIRKYRKIRNLTQEEVARRLGVTAPAVNKWENGNSMPDIQLLSPLSRLLGINPDTLLSFHEEPAAEEIRNLIYETDQRLKNNTYEDTLEWAEKIIKQYPNCEELILQMAVLFDARRLTDEIPNAEKYNDTIRSYYARALESENENIRCRAADALFGFYSRKEQYEKAEEYLAFLSPQNPEYKRKQADIFSKTGRIKEAYEAFEELLFSDYERISMILHSIYMLAMQDKDLKKAHFIVEKQLKLANTFDMGAYHEASLRLELATVEKDADTVIETMDEMLSSLHTITDFQKSPLYEHMQFKEAKEEFIKDLKENLLSCFRDEETFGFLKADRRYQELVGD